MFWLILLTKLNSHHKLSVRPSFWYSQLSNCSDIQIVDSQCVIKTEWSPFLVVRTLSIVFNGLKPVRPAGVQENSCPLSSNLNPLNEDHMFLVYCRSKCTDCQAGNVLDVFTGHPAPGDEQGRNTQSVHRSQCRVKFRWDLSTGQCLLSKVHCPSPMPTVRGPLSSVNVQC